MQGRGVHQTPYSLYAVLIYRKRAAAAAPTRPRGEKLATEPALGGVVLVGLAEVVELDSATR